MATNNFKSNITSFIKLINFRSKTFIYLIEKVLVSNDLEFIELLLNTISSNSNNNNNNNNNNKNNNNNNDLMTSKQFFKLVTKSEIPEKLKIELLDRGFFKNQKVLEYFLTLKIEK
ncbi:hypothetical protein ACTFIY_008241 [Dictyostelium cf. discoideum]